MVDTPQFGTVHVDAPGEPKVLRPFYVNRRFRHQKKASVVRNIRSGGRVVKVPCPDGSIKLIGMGPNDEWIAEWSCLEADWLDLMVDRMARHVQKSRAIALRHKLSVL